MRMKEDRSGNQSTLGDVGIRQVHDDLAGFVGLEEIFPQESMRTWNRNKGGEDQCANLERAWVRVPVDDNHYELQWTHRGRKHMEDPALMGLIWSDKSNCNSDRPRYKAIPYWFFTTPSPGFLLFRRRKITLCEEQLQNIQILYVS